MRLTAASAFVAVLTPLLLVTSALRIVANDWIVGFEYAHGGVPEDRYGLTRRERTELALVGLDAIRPGGRGVDLLREARLPDGTPAFNARELAHMQDVHDAVRVAFSYQLVSLVLVALLALALGIRRGSRAAVPRGLRWGAVATIAVAALVGGLMLAAWDGFFETFHGLFFSGETWRFPPGDALIRLYPDEFWMGVAAWIAGITVGLALAVAGTATWWLRRLRREGRAAGDRESVRGARPA